MNITDKMRQAYELRLKGLGDKDIGAEMGISASSAGNLLKRCADAGLEGTRLRRRRGTVCKPRKPLPPNMPSKKIPRCADCHLMLTDGPLGPQTVCINCPADSRCIMSLAIHQRNSPGGLSDRGEMPDTIDDGDEDSLRSAMRTFENRETKNAV